jgi:hypothetical protein
MSLMVAMDFSLSNGAINKPDSLHYIPTTSSPTDDPSLPNPKLSENNGITSRLSKQNR